VGRLPEQRCWMGREAISLVRQLHRQFQQGRSSPVEAETLALLEARIRKLQARAGGFATVRLSDDIQAPREQQVSAAPRGTMSSGKGDWAPVYSH